MTLQIVPLNERLPVHAAPTESAKAVTLRRHSMEFHGLSPQLTSNP